MPIFLALILGLVVSISSPGIVNAPEAVAETEEAIIATLALNTPIISQNSPNQASSPENSITSPYCSCIVTARLLGLNLPKLAYAKDLRPNLARPQLNAGVIFSYEPYGHIAVIKGMKGRDLLIVEGNFKRCTYTERWISVDDKRIVGYWIELSIDNQN